MTRETLTAEKNIEAAVSLLDSLYEVAEPDQELTEPPIHA